MSIVSLDNGHKGFLMSLTETKKTAIFGERQNNNSRFLHALFHKKLILLFYNIHE